MGSLRHGFAWSALSQGTSIAVTLLMLPVVVGRLGLAAYGVLTLVQSANSLLQTLDGGLLSAAGRSFGIAAGAQDRQGASDHFVTLGLAVTVLGCLLGAVLFQLAPQISDLFRISHSVRSEFVYAARIVSILLPVGLLAALLQSILTVNGQFRVMALTSALLILGYAIAVLVFVHHRHGVETVMDVTLLQQVMAVLIAIPFALRHVSPLRGRLLPWARIRALLSYSAQIQLTALVNVVNVQTDALIVGAILPIRYVALYGVGANLASQIRTIPLNLSEPLVSRLTQTLGRSGTEATFDEYARIQGTWVGIVSAFGAVMLGAAVFQLEGWLGQRFLTSGFVSVMLQAGNMVNLLTMPLATYLQIVGRPDLCLRYGMFGAGLNFLLTFAFIWVGVYGVAGGTAAGEILGAIGFVWLARRAVSSDIPSFLTPVPWLGVIAGGVTSAIAGAALLALAPSHGTQYLLLVSLCTIPGALAFMLGLLGPGGAYRVVRETATTHSLTPLIQALTLA